MLINKKAVRAMCRDQKKQAGDEFLNQLDYKVRQLVLRAISNARGFTRLKASELL
jgi:hypothetical protein